MSGRSDAEILAGLRAVFGEPVEGRDYHVMPDYAAEAQRAELHLDIPTDDAFDVLAPHRGHAQVTS